MLTEFNGTRIYLAIHPSAGPVSRTSMPWNVVICDKLRLKGIHKFLIEKTWLISFGAVYHFIYINYFKKMTFTESGQYISVYDDSDQEIDDREPEGNYFGCYIVQIFIMERFTRWYVLTRMTND